MKDNDDSMYDDLVMATVGAPRATIIAVNTAEIDQEAAAARWCAMVSGVPLVA